LFDCILIVQNDPISNVINTAVSVLEQTEQMQLHVYINAPAWSLLFAGIVVGAVLTVAIVRWIRWRRRKRESETTVETFALLKT